MSKVKKTIQWGKHTLSIETGVVARQATGAVMVSMGTTLVMVTVVGVESKSSGHGLPLKVDYSERFYAAGKIPGGFFKREGRPSEREVLISRLIDRPLRPLFPEGFSHEVQIIATVLSLDPEVESDILAMIGASAALAISGIPFEGPLGATRVGHINGQYVLNPTHKELADSKLDLVMACNKESVLMVESKADELSEDVMLGAVMYGYQQSQAVIQLIQELARDAGKAAWTWSKNARDEKLTTQIHTLAEVPLQDAYKIQDKQQRQSRVREIRERVIAKLTEGVEGDTVKLQEDINNIIEDLASSIVRTRIVTGQGRIDGRENHVVRPINIETSFLPRTHGSALFTRGETQSIVAVTLGSGKDAQIIDSLQGERKDPCILHYNFWPFSVGETGSIGSPKRREVGHGYLAKRAIQPVLPSADVFPYVLRIVSEITESNGSSSMATVCGSSLALMDAGVPIKSAVAGVAMGLIKEGSQYVVLTDILGDEDHLGDMDFKVAGTTSGVTALQMDIKINGITEAIMKDALSKAKDARMHILSVMQKAISAPRSQLSDFAPRIVSFKINPEKIRDVIGKGGVTIRALTEETGAIIELQDDGTVQIMSVDRAAGDEARRRIELLTAEVEVGQVYEGKVVRLAEFGAFVNLLPGKDGLLHISQISHERVEHVEDVLQEGQMVKVEVIEIDRQGRVRLSMKSIA